MARITPKMPIVPGTKCRPYVQERNLFTNNSGSLLAVNQRGLYAVLSYGPYFPIFIFDRETKWWFENTDKASVTTSKHQTQAHPHCDTLKLSKVQMERLFQLGSYGEYAKERVING